jgi:hypothetical protein
MTDDHYRRNLTEGQKQDLARFATKAKLTPYEQGQLAAFAVYGDDDEKKRAKAILARIDEEKAHA